MTFAEKGNQLFKTTKTKRWNTASYPGKSVSLWWTNKKCSWKIGICLIQRTDTPPRNLLSVCRINFPWKISISIPVNIATCKTIKRTDIFKNVIGGCFYIFITGKAHLRWSPARIDQMRLSVWVAQHDAGKKNAKKQKQHSNLKRIRSIQNSLPRPSSKIYQAPSLVEIQCKNNEKSWSQCYP